MFISKFKFFNLNNKNKNEFFFRKILLAMQRLGNRICHFQAAYQYNFYL